MKKIILSLVLFLTLFSVAYAGDLADVRDTGVLRFGTASERPPFVYYDEDDELTGIDISLMAEIASRMGVELEVFEMSVESLPGSLTVGQIDAAGGAFSVTEEREKTLDFTTVYYTTGGIFVSNSQLQLKEPLSPDSFAGLRIGAQKGSAFEAWLKTNFAGKDVIPERDIYTYSGIDDAVKALGKGRIDLILMDANVYMARYQSDTSLRSWQYGAAEDNYAFAVRKDSDLRAEIDGYLTAMLRDGTAQKIADQFFVDQMPAEENTIARPEATAAPVTVPTQVPTVIPTAVPTATPAPDRCTNYSMAYVADLTIPDGTYFTAGSKFTKTWRIKNSGSCNWTTDFSFEFVSGDAMGGANIRLPRTVYPGETIDISIDMTAPYYPGNYQGDWQLKTGSGYGVGPAIWVKITVPSSYTAPTSAPYNYPTNPAPDYGPVQQSVMPVILWFYPNFYSQKAGECVNIYWGLDQFSTAELLVDGVEVYYGSDERVVQQLCSQVKDPGTYEIELCAYASGGSVCDSLTYTATN